MGPVNSAQRCTVMRWLTTAAIAAIAVVSLLAPVAARARPSMPDLAVASSPLVHNPINDPKSGKPLSCPDPSVIREPHRAYKYFMACTSDFAGGVFPIWASKDGIDWRRLGTVFPRGSDPAWAIPTGHAHGRYWAPDLHYFDHHWVLYYAAELSAHERATLKPAPQGLFAIGVATTTNLGSGHWSSSLLHYSGQFNGIATQRGSREHKGGVIDPNEFQNPVTHQRYLVYAKQSNEIFLGTLAPNGLRLGSGVRLILKPSTTWECANARGTCTIEGPVGYWYDDVAYIMYSGSSTWAGTYTVGVAASTDPLITPFTKDPSPILSSSADLLGPGGTSEPVIAPDAGPIIYFHTLLKPDPGHISAHRYLTVGRFHYGSAAGATLTSTATGATVGITWPQISAGKPKNYTTLVRRGE
jgi:GH43 family beta-xylosidase